MSTNATTKCTASLHTKFGLCDKYSARDKFGVYIPNNLVYFIV